MYTQNIMSTPEEKIQAIQEETSRVWENIRKTGRLTCHNISIPAKCSQDICDDYPRVNLCEICNPCPCSRNSKVI